jgi:hypothetical protein
VLLLQLFGYDIWNGGGQTESFNDAYGRVTVFGEDSVRLEIVDEFGALIAGHIVLNQNKTAVAENENGSPARSFRLYPGFPNPVRLQSAAVTMRYELPQRAFVKVFVYDLLGRKVRAFEPFWREPGTYAHAWNGQNDQGEFVTSGVYLIRVQFTDGQGRQTWATQKLALVR